MRAILAALVVGGLLISGCVMTSGAVTGPIMVTKSPMQVGDSTVGASKVGRAEAQGIIIVAFGDATISTAMRNGGITKIHHVDSEETGVLGIYAKKTIIVYGE